MRRRTSFASRLARWFRRSRRELPWRSPRTPYRVLVSELMLQQTTVAAAVPYFERFTAVLPSFEDLAAASEEEVLGLWSGLGYYRRARSLRAAARLIVERHGGRFPESLGEALALPGVGPYTAGAVLSLVHGLRLPAVDGNVGRVLSRWLGRPLLASRAGDRRELQARALELMPRREPGAFNEALMELGALTCTPRKPDCPSCPLATDCRALLESRVEELPPRAVRPSPRRIEGAALLAIRRGRVLLQRRSDEEALLPGMWELPGGFAEGREPMGWLSAAVLPALGGGCIGERLFTHEHAITDRRIRLHVHEVELERPPRSGSTLRWANREESAKLALTGTTARLLPRILPA